MTFGGLCHNYKKKNKTVFIKEKIGFNEKIK